MTALASPDRRVTQISRFVESLQEPRTPSIFLNRMSAVLGVRRSSMADIIGVHRNPSSERLLADGIIAAG